MNRRVHFDIHFYFQLHEIKEKTPVHVYCADSFSFDFVKMWQKRNHYIQCLAMVLKSALICFSPQFIREPKMEVLFFTSLHLMVRIASASNSFSLKTWPSQQHMGIFQYITFCSPWDTSVVTRTKVTLYPQNWNWISIYFWKFAQNDILFVRSIFFFFSLSNTLQTCCWKILK